MRRGLLVVMVALVGACQKVEEERYELRGRVVSVDRAKRTVEVDHKAVEGLMPAMTMPFPVRDERMFDSLAPSVGLNAILVVRSRDGKKEFWLQELVVIRSPPPAEGAISAEALSIGELAPDVELVNQNGERFRLSDRRGKALLVTFIYTRCPLVDFCPRMTRQFEALEEMLQADPTLYQQTHLLTLSFDPEYDTPETLKAYAAKMVQATDETFAHWEFATGSSESIRAIASFLELEYRTEDNEIVHNLRTALLAPDGTLKEIYRGNEWKPEDALNDVKAVLGPR